MEAAHASFEAFLAREPGSGPGWFRLSLVEARQGRHTLAAAHAQRSLDLDPGQPEALSHLARCLLRSGAPERARAVALQAVALPRDKPVVLDSLAGVLARLDEQALALELFDRAIALDPDHASLYFNRALAHRQFGQIEAAENDLEACLARLPGHPKAHWALATLRGQDLAGNHVARLRRQLEQALPAHAEVLALALFKELDDLGDTPAAAQALARGLEARASRRAGDPAALARHATLVDELVTEVDSHWLRGAGQASEAAPVFVIGLPRSGVALLGSLLSRHPRLHWLGAQQAWGRRLQAAIGADGRALAPGDIARAAALDFARLGRDYLADVLPAGAKPPIACESTPLAYLQVGFIARALPNARFLHLVRDPVDACASLLFQPGQDHGLPVGDGASAATWHAQYTRLMRHWHELLPGRIMDVNYESLVAKPEMMLRVLCSFLGIRYASALRMGLQLHSRSIGRGHRYLAQLPGLGEALALQVRAA
jgi:Tfp pilus assembly protein PilF